MFKDWLNLGILLKKNAFSTHNFLCTECGKKSIDYLYVGDNKTNIGYFQMWCNSCNKGIHISRVMIPEEAKRIEFCDTESLLKLVPNYERIHP